MVGMGRALWSGPSRVSNLWAHRSPPLPSLREILRAESFDPQVELHWGDQRIYPDAPQHLRGVAEVITFTEQYRDGWADLVEAVEIIEAPAGRVLGLIRQPVASWV
jgi:hypothetical protein